MKSVLLTLFGILCFGFVVTGQTFNKTYFPAPDKKEDNKGNKVAILPWLNANSTLDDLIVFTVNNKNQSGNLTDLDIVVTNASNGSFVTAAKIESPLAHHHIAATRDSGIIFAGYADVVGSYNYLYIVKFDMLGTPQWQRRVPIHQKNIYGPYENVDIELIYDNVSGVENYFISFSEGNSIPGIENLPTQGVVKIDQNGNFYWHYCYERTNFRNESHAMTSFTPAGKNKALISLASTGKPTNSFARPCFMTIDQDGLIVTQMRGWWPLSDDERMPDILWDSLGQHFVTVFTSNTNAISYPVYSSLAILKMDETYDNAISGGLYHWLKANNAMWGERNEGVSITKTRAGDYYIITGWAKVLEGLVAMHQQLEAPFIFKILRTDPMNGDIPNVFNLRPLTDQNPVGHNLKYSNQFHVTDKDNQTYLVPSKHWLASGVHRPRLIKTDINFSNCQSFKVDLKYRQPFWVNSIYEHVAQRIMQVEESHLSIIPTLYDVQDCGTSGYKPLSIAPAAVNTSILVYPTIIRNGDKDVICEFKEGSEGEVLDVMVTNMLGQQTYKTQVVPHDNFTEKIPSVAFTSGMNMLNISIANKIVYSAKVVKL